MIKSNEKKLIQTDGIQYSCQRPPTDQYTGEAEYDGYISPTPGEIPIIARSIIRSINDTETRIPDNAELQQVLACGFNMFDSTKTVSEMEIVCSKLSDLDLKISANLKRIFQNPYCNDANSIVEVLNAWTSFVIDLKNESKIGVWDIIDEPRKEVLEKWCTVYNRILAMNTGKMPIINIGPETLSAPKIINNVAAVCPGDGVNLSLKDTLEKLFSLTKPLVMSFDCYPVSVIVPDIDTVDYPNNNVKIYEDYYQCLETLLAFSKKKAVPFWCYILSMQYTSVSSAGVCTLHPVTEATLYYMAFTSLAYGAQGLRYWTYAQRANQTKTDTQDNKVITEAYTNAPIGANGLKTPIWYWIQGLNAQVRKYQEVFLNSIVYDVVHIGPKKLAGTNAPEGIWFDIFYGFSYSRNGALISGLYKNSKKYVVVVNHSVTESEEISFKFESCNTVEKLTSNILFTEDEETEELHSKTPPPNPGIQPPPPAQTWTVKATFSLNPGGFAILSWK